METDLKLTGLMRFAGERPRALFASVGKDPKSTEYFNLSEGEHSGRMELVKVLEDQEGAEVILSGIKMTVWLKDSIPVSTMVATERARPTNAIPPVVGASLSAIQRSQLAEAWPVMSAGQRADMLADAQAGRPVQIIQVTYPEPEGQ